MAAAAASGSPDPLRPQRPAGLGRGAALALLVHGGLLLALTLGVSWRASEPTGVTAELWAAVPEFAAPAPVVQPPPPAPPPPQPAARVEPKPEPAPSRDAEIATEKAKREREAQKEREREKEREAKAEAEKKRLRAAQEEQRQKLAEKAEADRNEKLRQENLKRMLGQAGATGAPTATGNAARDAGPSASYAGRIAAAVYPNIKVANDEDIPKGIRAEVEVRAAPDGTILSRRLLRPSGNKEWDDAVLRALDRTAVLPRDVDGRVLPVFPIGFTH